MANPDEALEMSDEEFLKLGSDAFNSEASVEDKVETKPDLSNDTTDDESDTDAEEDGTETETNKPDTSTANEEAPEDDKEKKTETAIDKTDEKPSEASTEPDYTAIGKQLMAEFKANGTTMKIKTVEDAIQLMQMGANYHKKMAGLKPSLKTLKLLENNGLLDEAKLNYLIDLSQKKPEAITQLLKDSKIDPMTIDLQTEETYVPNQRTVSDTDILLDEVLDSISDSPTYSKTLTVLGEEWDANSRAAIVKNPEVIRAINAHMESGIYDQVAEAIAYERSLGKLVGLNDYDAYQRVGSYMHENNLFVGSANVKQTSANQTNTKPSPQHKTESDTQIQERLNRKQAASPSRQQKTVVKDTTNYNPLEMSDEEFVKLNKLRI
jgi:hypothetical protein